MYKYGVLDPRPGEAAEAMNAALLGPTTLGIEVTVPALAARCGLGNIDPQHSGVGDQAAIEVAWDHAFRFTMPAVVPPDAIIVTVRADLDSVGAMAALAMMAELREALGEVVAVSPEGKASVAGPIGSDGRTLDRVRQVADSDRFNRGGWPGPRPLPTKENPWPETQSARPLAAIASAVGDFKVPVAERVAAMKRWLLTGEDPAGYRDRVEAERLDLVRALEEGRIKAEAAADGRIAAVVSSHRAATSIGYALAPVVVAMNPQFRFQGGEPHAKFTVCQFAGGFVDLKAAAAELAGREAGWGGSPTIIGSPQGVGSILALEEVVAVVRRHLALKAA